MAHDARHKPLETQRMNKDCFATAIVVTTSVLISGLLAKDAVSQPSDPAAPPAAVKPVEVRKLDDVLEPIRLQYKLPALAAAVVKNDRLISLGAVGVRRTDNKDSVTSNDSFHLGSCTKAMTATLCAILVQQGKLKWDSTIGEVFADQRDKIKPEWHKVTLEQLLRHRSGLPDDTVPDATFLRVRALSGPMLKQRRQFIELVLSQNQTTAPGVKYQYSNAGYVLAGAMCERVTGKTWEDLMREMLFKPLAMTTAGFGPPGSAKAVDQPCGHFESGEKLAPMPPGSPLADNPAVMGPCGTVHCSLPDWAKFAALHLRGEKGKDPLLPDEVFRKLHTPTDGDYAYGWIVTKRGWAGGTVLTHSGSNTLWLAVIWVAPKLDTAYLAATNVGPNKGFEACDDAIGKLIAASKEKNHP